MKEWKEIRKEVCLLSSVVNLPCMQAIAEVQKRMKDVPLLSERELQIEKAIYKKAKK